MGGFSVSKISAIEKSPKVPYSGPVSVPVEEESPAIQAAPAYDTQAAKAYMDHIPEIRELVDSVIGEEGLAVFGKAVPSKAALGNLEAQIEKLMAGGHKVSVIMADLATKSGIVFHGNVPMCAQSTIKGIYIGALLDNQPEAFEKNGQYMHEAVVYSANEPYHNLREIYGSDPLKKWCREAGVDADFAESLYPRNKTARDMFRMWTRLYCYLNGEGSGSRFASWFADSSCSAAKKQLGGRFPVQTKAGWESGLDENRNYDPCAVAPEKYTDGNPENDECAINDTGVVYTDKGPYIFVIYTDHPFGVFRDYVTVNPLYELTEALYEVQCSLA